jgi:hypothetical protein
MTLKEAILFLSSLESKMVVHTRYGSNYDANRFLQVGGSENPWGPDEPDGPEDIKKKYAEAIDVLNYWAENHL